MGNAGFHSGELSAERIKSGGQYVNERQFIRKEDMNVTYISGTAALSHSVATGGQGVPAYSFISTADACVSYRFVAPASLKRKTKCNQRLYWTSALSGTTYGDVVWDADYWVTNKLVSGTILSGLNYNVSGSLVQTGGATVTTEYLHKPSSISGVLQESVLTIPAGDIRANDLVTVQIRRDTAETADTLDTSNALLIGVLVEYVEA